MAEKKYNLLVENLLALHPLIFKKLLRIKDPHYMEFSRAHFEVLFMLHKHGPATVSDIRSKTGISKPQMTAVINKLVQFGFVERNFSKEDRRAIILVLTRQGTMHIDHYQIKVRKDIEEKLQTLDENKLNDLLDAVKKVRDILASLP